MPVMAIAAVVAGAAFVGGSYMSARATNKQTKALKSANRFERQKASLQSARQKMEAVREGRRAMAEVQQNAENQGASGSSIGQGGAGSVFSQTQANLSFLDRYGYYSDQASKFGQKAANYGAQAGMWGQVAGIGAQVFGAVGGTGAFKGPPPPKPPVKQG